MKVLWEEERQGEQSPLGRGARIQQRQARLADGTMGRRRREQRGRRQGRRKRDWEQEDRRGRGGGGRDGALAHSSNSALHGARMQQQPAQGDFLGEGGELPGRGKQQQWRASRGPLCDGDMPREEEVLHGAHGASHEEAFSTKSWWQ
nr:unnamed protein product [Digitaria exilis]